MTLTTKQIRRTTNAKAKRPQCEQAHYNPTPEQIAAACEKIRSEWTPQQEYRRRGGVMAVLHQSPVERAREARINEAAMGECE